MNKDKDDVSLHHYRQYMLKNVVPGMKIGQPLITDNGKVVLHEGTILNEALIKRLHYWGVTELVIHDGTDTGGFFQPVSVPISQELQRFTKDYQETIKVLTQAFQSVRYFNEVPLNQMRELANDSVSNLVNSAGVMNHLQMVRHQDEYTFQHSVNVSVIAGVLGKWIGYQGIALQDIILTGLLHDIGKAKISLEVLNKPEKLLAEEMRLMQTHATLGYKLLRNIPDLPDEVVVGVLEHHERMDGSGYPLKLDGGRIHPYAKIIAVADVYDAMTSDRIYRAKVTPFFVLEMMAQKMFDEYDPSVCSIFLSHVRDCFVGSIVQLSDGRQAEIISAGQFLFTRPVVRTADGEFIDLETNKEITIAYVLKA
ncbi:MAG: HD-GYP domain-containing protein [Negativicutes bacterium]